MSLTLRVTLKTNRTKTQRQTKPRSPNLAHGSTLVVPTVAVVSWAELAKIKVAGSNISKSALKYRPPDMDLHLRVRLYL